jgi:predicted metal-dependent HD superfamily phosphohydrolase
LNHRVDLPELARAWPLRATGAGLRLRDRLLEAYAAPERGYHDLRHLGEVLARLDELAAAGEPFDRVPVVLAAWFHDAVYAGAADDEERSARLAAGELGELGTEARLVAEVVRLVLVTAEHRPEGGDLNGAALCDADLAVLAAAPDRYAEYVAGVRREYAHLDDEEFARGRRAVLSALAAKPTLFHTACARARWEPAARANLARELVGE